MRVGHVEGAGVAAGEGVGRLGHRGLVAEEEAHGPSRVTSAPWWNSTIWRQISRASASTRRSTRCARRPGSPTSPLGYFVLDRDAATFFLRTKSATFPGLRIAEMFGVEEGPLLEQMRRNILHINGDGHRRLRNLVNPAFTPRATERWRPAMREFLEQLWEPLEGSGRCEFVGDFAKPYPSLTIATVMGAPLEDAPRLHEWSNLIQRQFDPPSLMNEREAIERACEQFYEWAGALIERAQGRSGRRPDLDADRGVARGRPARRRRVHEPRAERAGGRGGHHAVAARPWPARVRGAPGPVGAARRAARARAGGGGGAAPLSSRSRRSPRACCTRRSSTAASRSRRTRS